MASHDNILETLHVFEITKLGESCKTIRIIIRVKTINPLKTERRFRRLISGRFFAVKNRHRLVMVNK
jgi:hypothetical protein